MQVSHSLPPPTLYHLRFLQVSIFYFLRFLLLPFRSPRDSHPRPFGPRALGNFWSVSPRRILPFRRFVGGFGRDWGDSYGPPTSLTFTLGCFAPTAKLLYKYL